MPDNSLIEITDNIFGSEEDEMAVSEFEDLYWSVINGDMRPEDAVMLAKEMDKEAS